MLPAGNLDEVERSSTTSSALEDGRNYRPKHVELIGILNNFVPPHPVYQPATSSVHYTTSCKHSLVLLRIGEIIARNILS